MRFEQHKTDLYTNRALILRTNSTHSVRYKVICGHEQWILRRLCTVLCYMCANALMTMKWNQSRFAPFQPLDQAIASLQISRNTSQRINTRTIYISWRFSLGASDLWKWKVGRGKWLRASNETIHLTVCKAIGFLCLSLVIYTIL